MKACLAFVGIAPALRGGAVFLLLSLALGACGDDDAAPDGGGAKDAGPDAGHGHFIPHPDAQVGTGGDPVPDCDRFDPLACGAGQQCRLVIRRPPGAMQFMIYSGCVENVDARAEGEPCDVWGGATTPYEAPNLQDELYIDPCAPGLLCAPDPKVRSHSTCQRACEPEVNVGCPMPTQYCALGGQTQLEQYCRDSDHCDPSDPTSCGDGRGCYLHLNDTGDAVLTVCLTAPTMPIADGEACSHYNDCVPGSSCWGPTRVPPPRWQTADLVCRRTCSASDAALDDAGTADNDGGTAGSGSCPGARSCVNFVGSGLDLSAIHSASVGQCE